MKRVDFIIPYVMGPNNGLELKYAIRSIEKNFKYDNYRIIVVGDRPEWLKVDNHLAFSRISHQEGRNFTDQLLKLYSVLTTMDIGTNFIWSYDDVYFTREVKIDDIKKLKAVASFDRYPNHLENAGAGPVWLRTIKATMKTVREKGGSNFNYETHLPRYFNKNRILKLIDKFNLLGQPLMLSSLYYNMYNRKDDPLCLFDSNPGIRFLLRTMLDVETLRKYMKKHQFTNNDPRTWNPVLQRVLLEMFPSKSGYEI